MKIWKSVFLSALLLAVFISYRPAHAADAIVSGACDEAAFNTALNTVQASPGGTITFNCGAAPFYIYFTAVKTITKNVVIDGANLAILSGGNATRLFGVGGGASLTLKNITVRNANSNGLDGGAILSSGSLVIQNSKLLNNTTGSTAVSGGAILNTGPLTITDSEFAYNTAGNGGALFPRWSAAVTNIDNSVFHDNQATNTTSGWGGAILAWDGAPLTITGSTFYANTAQNDGGALYIFANSSLSMSGSQVYSNNANNNGGAMNIQGTAGITDTLVSGTNRADQNGGGFYNNGTLGLNRVWLSWNQAIVGGGINNLGTLSIKNSTLYVNTAYRAGGIYNTGTMTLLNTTLANNQAYSSATSAEGGGIYVYGGTVNLNFVTMVDNSAFSGCCGVYGQSIYSSLGGAITVKNSIIKSTAGACYPVGAPNSAGFNIATDSSCGLTLLTDKPNTDPQLGALDYHGAATPNTLPNPGSPALDNGQCLGASTDQRGVARPQGASCDIGATERLGSEFAPWGFLPLVAR